MNLATPLLWSCLLIEYKISKHMLKLTDINHHVFWISRAKSQERYLTRKDINNILVSNRLSIISPLWPFQYRLQIGWIHTGVTDQNIVKSATNLWVFAHRRRLQSSPFSCYSYRLFHVIINILLEIKPMIIFDILHKKKAEYQVGFNC